MLHEKVFHVNKKKKVDVAQKSLSCRQKQDDAASKTYFVRKKVFIFFRNDAPYHNTCFHMNYNSSKYSQPSLFISNIFLVSQKMLSLSAFSNDK